ncbi:5126_t:CDS:2, partial [Acaulospora colombiana]
MGRADPARGFFAGCIQQTRPPLLKAELRSPALPLSRVPIVEDAQRKMHNSVYQLGAFWVLFAVLGKMLATCSIEQALWHELDSRFVRGLRWVKKRRSKYSEYSIKLNGGSCFWVLRRVERRALCSNQLRPDNFSLLSRVSANMSYASANLNTNTSALPDAHIKATTDPDKARKERAKDKLHKAEAEGEHLWAVVQEKLFQPAVAGGLFSVEYRSDYKVIGSSVVGTLLLLGAEGSMAEAYLQTEEGQREKRRAQEEGSALYRQTRESMWVSLVAWVTSPTFTGTTLSGIAAMSLESLPEPPHCLLPK